MYGRLTHEMNKIKIFSILPELTPTKNLAANIQYFRYEGNNSSDEYIALANVNNAKETNTGNLIEPNLLLHHPTSGENSI